MVNWLPTMSMGSYTGQYQAGWTVTGNDDYLVYGGEFLLHGFGAFAHQPVDVRGFVAQGSGEGEVSVSGVVEVDEDEIDVIGSFRLRVARDDPCGGRGRRQNG